MKLDETTWLIIYLIAGLIALAIQYYVIKLAIKDALKERDTPTKKDEDAASLRLLEKQNALLTLLVAKAYEGGSFALTENIGSAVKIIKAEELNKFPLENYKIESIGKSN